MKKHLPLLAFFLVAIAGTTAAQAQTSPSPAPAASPAPAPAASPAAAPSPSAAPSPPPHLIQLSGFADAAYTSHVGPNLTEFSAPNAFGAPITPGFASRVFDYNDRTITLQNLNVQAALNAGNLTGKVELSAGSDANIIQSWPAAFNGFDVTQAYLAYQLGKLSVQGGKFETLAGAEVIESPSDLNFSRSILFGFAVPFTHTGGRLTYALAPHVNIIGGVNAGWDEVRSTNGRLTAEYGLAFNPSSAVSVTAQGYTGFEQLANYSVGYDPYATSYNVLATPPVLPPNSQPSGAQGQRSLIDVVGTVHPTGATTVTVNYDKGLQRNFFNPFTETTLNAGWSGLAGYLSYQVTPKFVASARYEGFSDPQGYRTGIFSSTGAGPFWHEGTFTVGYNLTSALTVRGEYRHDTISEPAFLQSNAASLGTNTNTIGLEGLVKF